MQGNVECNKDHAAIHYVQCPHLPSPSSFSALLLSAFLIGHEMTSMIIYGGVQISPFFTGNTHTHTHKDCYNLNLYCKFSYHFLCSHPAFWKDIQSHDTLVKKAC